MTRSRRHAAPKIARKKFLIEPGGNADKKRYSAMGLRLDGGAETGAEHHGEGWTPSGGAQLDAIARSLSRAGPPIVVFNASHSGSRLLASLLRQLGVFMGADLNESGDSLPVFDLVRYLVESHAPNFSRLMQDGDEALPRLVRQAFLAHLAGRPPHQPWGWKLCETGLVLPVISRIFPKARLIHLVRDGRDVAFSPFVAPKAPFWRKVYFGSDKIRRWNGLAMTQRAYRAHGHVFNAARWVHVVTVGRAQGAMLGERFYEMKYEDLTADPGRELARLAAFLGIDGAISADVTSGVRATGVGKWRQRPAREIAEVRAVLEPTLSSFGYGWDEEPVWGTARAPRVRGLSDFWRSWEGVSAGSHANPGGLGGLFRVRGKR
jgi:sulfotransferase family protein